MREAVRKLNRGLIGAKSILQHWKKTKTFQNRLRHSRRRLGPKDLYAHCEDRGEEERRKTSGAERFIYTLGTARREGGEEEKR